jgi:UDP-N-acetylmuramate--alanine ligase
MITRKLKSLCVAGTHGKSTTSSMLAHILNQSSHKCNAFLGAIATNFDSNLLLNSSAEYTVVEADEFDRSFLQLTPFCSIITSADPDHLDIYGSAEKFKEGFKQYAMKIDPNGFAVVKEGLELKTLAKQITYAIDSETADCSILSLGSEEGISFCDCNIMGAFWPKVYLGLPGIHNAENALACIALLNALGVPENEIRSGLKSFSGLKRRFETIISNEKITFIDDYAHHPTEIDALISSLRMLYPGKKITGVFQPHLFSRTKDFSYQFSQSLSALDSLILLPIYPAREAPILGISSELLLEGVSIKDKKLLSKEGLLHYLKDFNNAVLVTIGAGDIDRLVQPIKEILTLNLDL